MKRYFLNIWETVKTMLIGMSITIKHMFKIRKGNVTLQYPEEKWPRPERKIGFEHSDYNVIRSRLNVDMDDCIGCRQCERACPVDCIKIDTVKSAKGVDIGTTSNDTKKRLIVTRFDIDMSECMYCNLCTYGCPEDCIYMVGGPNSHKYPIDYEFSEYNREKLIYSFATVTPEELERFTTPIVVENPDESTGKTENKKAVL